MARIGGELPLHLKGAIEPVEHTIEHRHQPGELVDVGGYVGVVVSVENDSIKVRSRQGTSRKYNAAILPKLQGSASTG